MKLQYLILLVLVAAAAVAAVRMLRNQADRQAMLALEAQNVTAAAKQSRSLHLMRSALM